MRRGHLSTVRANQVIIHDLKHVHHEIKSLSEIEIEIAPAFHQRSYDFFEVVCLHEHLLIAIVGC